MVSIPAGSSDLHGVPVGRILRARLSTAPVTLPLRNNWTYARFRHLQGVPGGEAGGYSVSRLRALDALIDRLAVAPAGDRGRAEGAQPQGGTVQPDALSSAHRHDLPAMHDGRPQDRFGGTAGNGAAGGGSAGTGAVLDLMA